MNAMSGASGNEAFDAVHHALQTVIRLHTAYSATSDIVGRALLIFVVRLSNTWISLRTLRNNNPDQAKEIFVVDGGALLRAMLDAGLQAEYIVHESTGQIERATRYVEFEHIERYKNSQRILAHDLPFCRRFKNSPRRAEAEPAVKAKYDELKGNYPHHQHWYPQRNLQELAKDIGRLAEYDVFLAQFHGCVHSGPMSLIHGTAVREDHVLTFASRIACRTAMLLVRHHGFSLTRNDGAILGSMGRIEGSMFDDFDID